MLKNGLIFSLLLALWTPSRALPQGAETSSAEKVQAVFSAPVELGRERFSLPARRTAAGPLFLLQPLAERLGGQLERGAYGESYELKTLDQELIFGPESPAMTIGERILRLSQPPMSSVSGLLVPLDLLEEAFGGLGYRFEWDRTALSLRIERRESRILLVATELVHLQGATTLAFQFSEPPRYRIEELPGLVMIEVRGDRLRPRGRPPAGDPLVRRVSIDDQRIRISLEADAQTNSYVLENPFRLVFDVFRGQATGNEAPARIHRPRRRAGVNTIVIDPGHGGSETGARSASGVLEKDLTLILAKALRRKLRSRLPVEVVLTREGDEELALPTRTAIANENKADLFISLHLNSSYGAKAHGAETYILSTEASDAQAADAARAENEAGARRRLRRRPPLRFAADPLGSQPEPPPVRKPTLRDPGPGGAQPGLEPPGPRGQAGAFPGVGGCGDARGVGRAGFPEQSHGKMRSCRIRSTARSWWTRWSEP